MLKRLSILVKLQLSNKTRRFHIKSKKLYSFIALRLAAILIITAIICAVLYFLKNFLYIPVNHYLLIFMLILTQVLSIIAALLGLTVDIYHSKDNQILFTLPAKGDEIFMSKLIVYYINEFEKNLYFLFPFLIAYGQATSQGSAYYASIIPVLLVLPFISVFFSSFLSIILTFVKNYLNKHNFVLFGLWVVLIVAMFGLVYYLAGFIPESIRLVQLYNSFITGLKHFMQAVASYGLIYSVVGQLMNGIDVIVNWLIVIITVLVLFGINYGISRPLFFHLTSATVEPLRMRKHRAQEPRYKGLFWTFLRKEITIMKRSPNELLSNYAILIALPLVMFVLNKLYMGIDRSSLGNSLVLISNIFTTLVLVSASNTASAAAITTEGLEFVLLKTAPSKTQQVAWAKIMFNIVVTSTLILLSFFLFQWALPVFDKVDIWLLFLFVFFYNLGHIFWSFTLDLVSPKLAEYASTGSLSNNPNISRSLSGGLFFSIVFSLIGAIVFIVFPTVAWLVLLIIVFALFLFRIYIFTRSLHAYFIDIEY